MRRLLAIGLIIALGSYSSRASAAGEVALVAVFDLDGHAAKVPSKTCGALTDLLRAKLASTAGYGVVPTAAIRTALAEGKKSSYRSCFDESCQIDIGKEVAAQKSLSSKILKLGSSCHVVLELYDLKTAKSESAATIEGTCSEDGLVKSMSAAIAALTKPRAEPQPEPQKPIEPAKEAAQTAQASSIPDCWRRTDLDAPALKATIDGEKSRARAMATVALEECPGSPLAHFWVWYSERTSLDHAKAAFEGFEKMATVDPTSAWIWHKLGVLSADFKGDQDSALKHFQKSVQLDPNYGRALQRLGYYYEMMAGDLDRALVYYERAVRVDASSPYALSGMCSVYIKKQDNARALPYAQRAVEAAPNVPEARVQLGWLNETYVGDAAKAIEHYDRACSVGHQDGCQRAVTVRQNVANQRQP